MTHLLRKSAVNNFSVARLWPYLHFGHNVQNNQ